MAARSTAKLKGVTAPKVPTQAEMRRKAEMWLDFFEGFLERSEVSELSQEKRLQAVNDAGELATRAMDVFEEKWVGVKFP